MYSFIEKYIIKKKNYINLTFIITSKKNFLNIYSKETVTYPEGTLPYQQIYYVHCVSLGHIVTSQKLSSPWQPPLSPVPPSPLITNVNLTNALLKKWSSEF